MYFVFHRMNWRGFLADNNRDYILGKWVEQPIGLTVHGDGIFSN